MKVLIFTPTTENGLNPKLIPSLLAQEGVEFVDLMVTKDNPYDYTRGEIMRNIQLNYEKMRQLAIKNEYDKVFIVEQDMIVPKDALRKLLDADAPMATGLYALRHGTPVSNLFAWHQKIKHLGNSVRWEEIKAKWGELIRVTGGAMGCLLLDKSVLNFNFMIDECRAPDMAMMQYYANNGVEMKADLSVICGHIRPNGEILWPDKDKGYRIERIAI